MLPNVPVLLKLKVHLHQYKSSKMSGLQRYKINEKYCNAFEYVQCLSPCRIHSCFVFLRDKLQNLYGFLLKCWSPQAIWSHQKVIFLWVLCHLASFLCPENSVLLNWDFRIWIVDYFFFSLNKLVQKIKTKKTNKQTTKLYLWSTVSTAVTDYQLFR